VLIISLVIAVVFITLFTKRIRNRLDKITHVLKEAGMGKFTSQLVDKTGDELSQVSTSYNAMSLNLKQLIKKLPLTQMK
ncbi:MAG: methyl-accepting chemotaxis protein, partial [Kurthia sp.]|nr:methyl-accepting chemotaxis protein [Candidatus Kurthia equi]